MELLVVIGIIALLISMLLPALQKARFSGNVVACASNQRQIYTAMVMYANDNRGFLPGTRIWNNNANGGDIYASWGGDYPWEAPGTGTSTPWPARTFGIGQLLEGKYLPPSRVITCTDFQTSNTSSFLVDGGFDLDWRVDNIFNGTGAFIQGSYALNTVPYYSTHPSNRARGKIGKPGRDGGYWLAGNQVPNITAYIMCTSGIGSGSGLKPSTAHERKGVNVTYIDGHVVYQPISATTWANLMWYDTFVNTAGDCVGERGFWPWATQVE